MGVAHTEDGARFAGRERLQTDPVGQVGVQPAEPALVEPLTRQQQMHAQRPSDAPDREEQFREIRLLGQQFGEFVDHDQQHGQCH